MAKQLGVAAAVRLAGESDSSQENQVGVASATLYMPPPSIMKRLIRRQSAGAGRDTVTMSVKTFHKLMEAAFGGLLDEEAYLEKHADIRAAVKAGALPSALRHFATDGYFEGRGTFIHDVDEAWYLETYPDVAQAITSGKVRNATHHFEAFGYAEGRVPSRALQQTVAEWRDLEKKHSM